MSEHVTRGQVIRTVQLISRRHPSLLHKDWLYNQLKPIVDGLAADLKEAKAAEEAAKKQAAQAAKKAAEEQAKAAQAQDEAKDAPAQPDAKATNDLGDAPKKPVEEKGKQTKGSKPKEKKK